MPYIPFTYIPSTGPSLADLLFPDTSEEEEQSEENKRWEREEEERRRARNR